MSDQRQPDDQLTPALRELGDHLRQAAHREYGAPARRRRRVSRRSLVLAGAVIVVGVGAATAADLISVGTPARNLPSVPGGLRPNSTARRVVLTAPDPGRKLPWGVAPYTAKDGSDCVLLGQASVGRLGVVTGGVFHPYLDDRTGICGHLRAAPLVFSAITTKDEPRRTIVAGRARSGIGFVTISEPGGKHRVNTGPDGAFLAVLDGTIDGRLVGVLPLSGAGP